MTKAEFLELIENVPDDTQLVVMVGDRLIDVCGLSDTVEVVDEENNKTNLFLIQPCNCHEEDDLIDEFESLLEEEIIEPVYVDEINLN